MVLFFADPHAHRLSCICNIALVTMITEAYYCPSSSSHILSQDKQSPCFNSTRGAIHRYLDILRPYSRNAVCRLLISEASFILPSFCILYTLYQQTVYQVKRPLLDKQESGSHSMSKFLQFPSIACFSKVIDST